MRIALIQTSASEDIKLNLENAIGLAKRAAKDGGEIICLPELYRTRYFPQSECIDASAFSETIPGESTRRFSEVAKKHNCVIIVPLFEREGSRFYNAAAVIDCDGSLLGTYRKVHIPHDPLFYEKNYFMEDVGGFKAFDTSAGRIAVLICYDQWFPEAARAAALERAEIIFYPTAIGWISGMELPDEGDWHQAWELVQRGHAIANGIPVAAVNRIGAEGMLRFWGGSFVCDAFGAVQARGGDSEEIITADVDLEKGRSVRAGWGFFRNRRPGAYSSLVDLSRGVSFGPHSFSPSQAGYRMPAEWEPHDAIWLSWPHDPTTFADIPAVERAYVSMIKEIHTSERVYLLVKDSMMRRRVEDSLQSKGVDMRRLAIWTEDYADVWFRDYGPTFLVDEGRGKLAMVHWIFNAWGCKYEELMRDAAIPSVMNGKMLIPCFEPGIVLEGGSIEVNGRGTVMTTLQCLLNRNRNPRMTRDQIETMLCLYLGTKRVIWLNEGIAGDDTDGHIDDVARFVGPSTVLCAFEDDRDDENYGPLKDCYDRLRSETDQDGRQLHVVKLPMPGRIMDDEGKRLPASYANFYIGNDVVLAPIFGHHNDALALETIQKVFPGRRVAGIDCRAMVYGLGSIHCVSQQQPAVNR